ncbi:unnamed protein product, partial [Mesorhabditis spiculigera]
VHHVSVHDQGFYNCTATNTEGIATSSSEVEVVRAEAPKRRTRKEPKAPQFIEVLPGVLRGTAGEQTTVECSVSGFPSPSIVWMRNGQALVPSDRYLMSYDGECATLKFAHVTLADEGSYACVATNQNGDAKTQMKFEVAPGVHKTGDGQAPLFRAERLKDRIRVRDGQPCSLEAEIIGGSEPLTIKWLRDGVQIEDSAAFRYSQSGKICRLAVADAFPEDAGQYSCEARNQWGVARCQMRMEVYSDEKPAGEQAPKILDAPAGLSADLGMPLVIKAKIVGHPDPVVEWHKGTEKVINSDKYKMTSDGESMILTISDTNRRDAGKYRITASNHAGQTTHTVDVTVREPTPSGSSANQPRFLVHPVSMQAAVGQKAQLQCSFEGKPMPVVSWFRDDVRIRDGVGGYSIDTRDGDSTLSVVYMEKEHFGEYLCTVRNPYGEDLATAKLLLEAVLRLLSTTVLVAFCAVVRSSVRSNVFLEGTTAALPQRCPAARK